MIDGLFIRGRVARKRPSIFVGLRQQPQNFEERFTMFAVNTSWHCQHTHEKLKRTHVLGTDLYTLLDNRSNDSEGKKISKKNLMKLELEPVKPTRRTRV